MALTSSALPDHAKDLDAEIRDALESSEQQDVVALLLAVQDRLGYVPSRALEAIAARRGRSPAELWGVLTFYPSLRRSPPGRRHVRVCTGTACHVRGAQAILEEWERRLCIGDGQVRPDQSYSLERVACVGCCALAPVSVVGDRVHGQMAPAMIEDLLTRHALEDEAKDRDGPADTDL
jgi:NADH-quinone oxidoreductase subunit E